MSDSSIASAEMSRLALSMAPAASEASVTVLVVGGTGESDDRDTRREVSGLLAGVTDVLDERFASRWVGYPASYGPAPALGGISYEDSVSEGVRRLEQVAVATPGPLMLIGYSQGAVVVRRYLARRAGAELSRILAAGFVADPHQPPGVVAGCEGWGVAGPGAPLPAGIAAHWVGAREDMICNAAGDSFVRDIADLTGQLTFSRLGRWLVSVWMVLVRNSFQNASRTGFGPRQWRRDVVRLISTAQELRGYLPSIFAWRGLVVRNVRGGRHTSYAAEPYRRERITDPETTGCAELARWLQVVATFGVGPAGTAQARSHAA